MQAKAGAPIKEISRKYGVDDGSFCKWHSKHGSSDANEAKQLRVSELKSDKLKRLLAETRLDIYALNGIFGTKRWSHRSNARRLRLW